MGDVDNLVLGTTNAPYRRSITAAELAACLTSGNFATWTVHITTFFTEVRPKLVLEFAEAHGISRVALTSAYHRMKSSTGEANPVLEGALERLAQTA